METFTLILAIVCLVFGILQIILFFKVWNMMFFYKSDGDVGRVFRI